MNLSIFFLHKSWIGLTFCKIIFWTTSIEFDLRKSKLSLYSEFIPICINLTNIWLDLHWNEKSTSLSCPKICLDTISISELSSYRDAIDAAGSHLQNTCQSSLSSERQCGGLCKLFINEHYFII